MSEDQRHDDLFDGTNTANEERTWSNAIRDPLRLAYRDRVTFWILCVYCGSGGMPPYADSGHAMQGGIASFIGVPVLANPKCENYQVGQALRQAFAAFAGSTQSEPTMPAVGACGMRDNIQYMAGIVGLSDLEQDILELLCAVEVFQPLRLALDMWGEMMEREAVNALSLLLGCQRTEMERALSLDGRLRDSGLVVPTIHHEATIHQLLRVPRKLVHRLVSAPQEMDGLLSNLVSPLKATKLSLEDFGHMRAHTELAQLWLQGSVCASECKEPAGHLLVSGPPGLGKTEWVRALLAVYAPKSREMVVVDEMGRALSGHSRLNHLRIAMVMLERSAQTVILFDEADDVFDSNADFESGATSSGDESFGVSMVSHRASLNRLIEESRIPVIWIMNRPEILDPAVLRRFDAVVVFKPVARSTRLRMLQKRFSPPTWLSTEDGNAFQGQAISNGELQLWASTEELTPALIDRLASMHRRAAQAGSPMSAALSRHWIRQRLPAQSTKHLLEHCRAHAFEGAWSHEFVNASEDLMALAQGVARTGSARILLYGAPGTGKTAYAHALARHIDRPLLEHRASTLLSPYVGETEARIDAAFSAALDDGAVLFLDEVDSLLASRDMAVRTWEVSQVNELLEQLGDYAGVVVLATNRLDALDHAVLRRRDAKIKFAAMTSNQVQKAFTVLCQSQGIQVNSEELLRVGAIENLTAGDFACVARKLRFANAGWAQSESGAEQLIELLKAEVNLKTRERRSIGFYNAGEST